MNEAAVGAPRDNGSGLSARSTRYGSAGLGAWACSIWFWCAGWLAASAQPVRLSEIFYHPGGTNRPAQWVELHNTTTQPVDLTGWRLGGAVELVFPASTILASDEYLVVAADAATFRQDHPAVDRVVGGWRGVLGWGGDAIRLEDARGREVETVHYANEGDWAVRRLSAPDSLGRVGWEWFTEHAGGGMSAELVNERFPGTNGQNWAASLVAGGTPGRRNSAARENTPPWVLDLVHSPAIPRSTDSVRVSARILDEDTAGVVCRLFWRIDGQPAFESERLFDDGTHGDGLAGDGLFAAVLPPRASGTVVEFYVQVEDAEANTRTYPAVVPSGTARTAYPVYQVDDAEDVGDQPVYRLVMPQAEYDYLAKEIWGGAPRSDAMVHGTFVSRDGVLDGGTTVQVRYGCGFRNRGHGTRTAVPHNFHVAFPADRPWKGRSGINLNTSYTHSQHAGSTLLRVLGIPVADSRPVQVRVQGQNLAKPGQEQFGSYAFNEAVDDRLVRHQFPDDPDGNLYRGVRDLVPGIRAAADLTWRGASFEAYTNAYSKENHGTLNDWSDFIRLLDALNHAPDATYAAEVATVVDVDQWMRYFAANTLLDNDENSLANGSGDDFGLYRGTRDPRFRLLAYDLDSILGRGTGETSTRRGLWRMTNLVVLDRFMKHPEFAPIYYRHLRSFAEGSFAPRHVSPWLDQLLGSYVDATALRRMKAFHSNHVEYVLSLVPRGLTVVHGLSVVSGWPRSTSATVALSGNADPVRTRAVRVQGKSARWVAWTASWSLEEVALAPGVNRVAVEALDANGVVIDRASIDLWYDDGSVESVSGTLAADTVWSAARGPYQVTSSITVAAGATLSVEPGTTVYFSAGAQLVVADGGRLLAEGTASAPIRFGVAPGASSRWKGVVIQGRVGSPETRLRHVHIEGNDDTAVHSVGGTLGMASVTFGSSDTQYLSLDDASFVVSDCIFPSASVPFELVHGSGGIKAGGRGIFLRNLFGTTMGYNDVIDFTGGRRREGRPIVQFIENVFLGTSDDELDLDGTDAWVEGNIFLHVHKNGSPDSSSAISGGSNGGDVSSVTIVGNLFYDCDQAATAKQGNFYTVLNNTIVRQTRVGGLDTDAAVFNFADDGTSEGAGLYAEGNIIVDAEKLLRNHSTAAVTLTNNVLPFAWSGPGGGNSMADPLLVNVPRMEETQFRTFEEAQVMREWFRLRPASPGVRSGPNGRDLGGVIERGVSVSGVPPGTNRSTTVMARVGSLLLPPLVPAAGWPKGSGHTGYRWRLDGDAWVSADAASAPLILENLSPGSHVLEVAGINDAGLAQDDPLLEGTGRITRLAWSVDPSAPPPALPGLRLSEVFAGAALPAGADEAEGDWVELVNEGSEPLDLSGFGLSDDPGQPYPLTFPSGLRIPAGGWLVVAVAGGTVRLPFGLDRAGDSVFLFEPLARGGRLVDSLTFGWQIPGHSVARVGTGDWALARPTRGSRNEAAVVGEARRLKINEWLADAQFATDSDFLELYNPEPRPVALGGLALTDAAGSVFRHTVRALSFIEGRGYLRLVADGGVSAQADHLGFRLSPEGGVIRLSDAEGQPIDVVSYGPQRTDVSMGRTPNGADTMATFLVPTPGASNPGTVSSGCELATEVVPLLPFDGTWRYNQTENLDGRAWFAVDYDDSAWPSGEALLAAETSSLPSPGKRTNLTLGRSTYYFRSRFVVATPLTGFQLNVRLALDDGAIVYLNGTKVLSQGMGTGNVTYSTFASRNVDNATLEYFTVPGDALVVGTNVIAAEVHQANAGSSDVVWGLGLEASRTYTNCAPAEAITVVLNEVLASNASFTNHGSVTADYVELHNPGPSPVDLGGLGLTDDPGFPAKWVFPTGVTVGPGAFLTVLCDPLLASGATNTGFGLSADGGVVYLFHRASAGGGLVDAVRYGLQARDLSVGRVPDGVGVWTLGSPTPTAANRAVALGSIGSVRVNEWMADPISGDDWFELWNSGDLPVAMGGLYLTDSFADPTQSPMAPLSFIGTGPDAHRRMWADGLGGAGADHVGFSLRKGGEQLGLFSPTGVLLDGVAFGAQQTGVSRGRFPDGADVFVSFTGTESPGLPNRLPLEAPRVNEILPRGDGALEGAVEILNASDRPVDVGGWFLSNSRSQPRKYRIPEATVVPAGGLHVFYESDYGRGPSGFVFDAARGDSVVLSQVDSAGQFTGYSDVVRFEPLEAGRSWGRVSTSVGAQWAVMAERSFGVDAPATLESFRTGRGKTNGAPRVGPIVLAEIHYFPDARGGESADDEFIELENIGDRVEYLSDPTSATNRWSLAGAAEFEFPDGTALVPGARLLVVGFSPDDVERVTAFRRRWDVTSDVPIVGPWWGRLANEGDRVELRRSARTGLARPGTVEPVPQVLVDWVEYLPRSPWPAGAAGQGGSLQRRPSSSFGNDPVNWTAAPPTPGRVPGVAFADSDADGLEDAWEIRWFGALDRAAAGDEDGDGMSNVQEQTAGTNPTLTSDALRVSLEPGTETVSVRFLAVAGRSYSVLWTESLEGAPWRKLADVPLTAVSGPVRVVDPAGFAGTRYYRVITPRVP